MTGTLSLAAWMRSPRPVAPEVACVARHCPYPRCGSLAIGDTDTEADEALAHHDAACHPGERS